MTSWEQTRISLYYLYCSYPKKSRNPSYTIFRKEHMPFPWDGKRKEKVVEDQQSVTAEEWFQKIAKMSGGNTNVSADEIEKTGLAL